MRGCLGELFGESFEFLLIALSKLIGLRPLPSISLMKSEASLGFEFSSSAAAAVVVLGIVARFFYEVKFVALF